MLEATNKILQIEKNCLLHWVKVYEWKEHEEMHLAIQISCQIPTRSFDIRLLIWINLDH